jgi:hypothetical protein
MILNSGGLVWTISLVTLYNARKLTLNRIRYFNSSGLGRLALSSSLSVIKAEPSSSRIIAASITCCSSPHRVSAEMMMGYGEVMNAYFLIALQMDLTDTEEVRVTRWYATGSTSPSCMSTICQLCIQTTPKDGTYSRHTGNWQVKPVCSPQQYFPHAIARRPDMYCGNLKYNTRSKVESCPSPQAVSCRTKRGI